MTATIDASVLKALENRVLWNKPGRPVSRRGHFAVRADELARHLKLSQDTVTESLSRLAVSGNVLDIGGTTEDNTPRYHFVQSLKGRRVHIAAILKGAGDYEGICTVSATQTRTHTLFYLDFQMSQAEKVPDGEYTASFFGERVVCFEKLGDKWIWKYRK